MRKLQIPLDLIPVFFATFFMMQLSFALSVCKKSCIFHSNYQVYCNKKNKAYPWTRLDAQKVAKYLLNFLTEKPVFVGVAKDLMK